MAVDLQSQDASKSIGIYLCVYMLCVYMLYIYISYTLLQAPLIFEVTDLSCMHSPTLAESDYIPAPVYKIRVSGEGENSQE